MKSWTIGRLCIPLLLTIMLVPSNAHGQVNDSARKRTLAGHTFIPSSLIQDPFVTTQVRSRTGAGLASKVRTELESDVLDPQISVLQGDLAFLTQEFAYQHALNDWLALGATFKGAARMGTGVQSVIAQGITSIFGMEFRGLVRLVQRDKWMLSANLQFHPTSQYAVELIPFVRQAIDEGRITEDNSLVRASKTVPGTLGLRGAYAPNPSVGFLLLGDLGYADSFGEGSRDGLASVFGGMVSWDLDPGRSIPIGLILSLKHDQLVVEHSDIAENATSVGGGIAYTGRSDFSLSVEGSHVRIPLAANDQSVTAMTVSFNMRYFF